MVDDPGRQRARREGQGAAHRGGFRGAKRAPVPGHEHIPVRCFFGVCGAGQQPGDGGEATDLGGGAGGHIRLSVGQPELNQIAVSHTGRGPRPASTATAGRRSSQRGAHRCVTTSLSVVEQERGRPGTLASPTTVGCPYPRASFYVRALYPNHSTPAGRVGYGGVSWLAKGYQ